MELIEKIRNIKAQDSNIMWLILSVIGILLGLLIVLLLSGKLLNVARWAVQSTG